MPIVNIDVVPELMAGNRTVQYEQMTAGVTDAITKSTGAPAESVHILIHEVSDVKYSVGGVLLRQRMAGHSPQS